MGPKALDPGLQSACTAPGSDPGPLLGPGPEGQAAPEVPGPPGPMPNETHKAPDLEPCGSAPDPSPTPRAHPTQAPDEELSGLHSSQPQSPTPNHQRQSLEAWVFISDVPPSACLHARRSSYESHGSRLPAN